MAQVTRSLIKVLLRRLHPGDVTRLDLGYPDGLDLGRGDVTRLGLGFLGYPE